MKYLMTILLFTICNIGQAQKIVLTTDSTFAIPKLNFNANKELKINSMQAEIPIVKPTDGIVNGLKIPSYKNSWRMTMIDAEGNETERGKWDDEISFTEKNGQSILRREQHVFYTDNEVIQIDEVNRKTLQPIYISVQNANADKPHTWAKFEGNKITGHKTFNTEGFANSPKVGASFTYELQEPIFDWHLWGILIAAFPLQKNYAARFLAFESYTYSSSVFRWYTLQVEGNEVINAGKWGTINCWRVKVIAEVPWTIWISTQPDTAPVLQIKIDIPGNIQHWWRSI